MCCTYALLPLRLHTPQGRDVFEAPIAKPMCSSFGCQGGHTSWLSQIGPWCLRCGQLSPSPLVRRASSTAAAIIGWACRPSQLNGSRWCVAMAAASIKAPATAQGALQWALHVREADPEEDCDERADVALVYPDWPCSWQHLLQQLRDAGAVRQEWRLLNKEQQLFDAGACVPAASRGTTGRRIPAMQCAAQSLLETTPTGRAPVPATSQAAPSRSRLNSKSAHHGER